jgi:hypothetical protein
LNHFDPIDIKKYLVKSQERNSNSSCRCRKHLGRGEQININPGTAIFMTEFEAARQLIDHRTCPAPDKTLNR